MTTSTTETITFTFEEWKSEAIYYNTSMFHVTFDGLSETIELTPLKQYADHFKETGYRKIIDVRNQFNWITKV